MPPRSKSRLSLQDRKWLLKAIELSTHSPKRCASYAVGALIVESQEKLIGSGYSLEWGSGWHAEAIAIDKALRHRAHLNGLTPYTSMEPCSVRRSGRRSCTDAIIASGLSNVVYAWKEPPIFVDCQGTAILRKHGVEVHHLNALSSLAMAVNRHLLGSPPHSKPPPRAR